MILGGENKIAVQGKRKEIGRLFIVNVEGSGVNLLLVV